MFSTRLKAISLFKATTASWKTPYVKLNPVGQNSTFTGFAVQHCQQTRRSNFILALIQAVFTKPLLNQALWGWENTAQNKKSLCPLGSLNSKERHGNDYAARQTVIRTEMEVKQHAIEEPGMKD